MKQKILSLFSRLKQSSFYETFTDISTYFSAQVAIQILGVISLPVFTHFLDTDGYGIVKVYLSYATVFSILLGFNLFGAVSRYYYEEREDFSSFLGTTLLVSLMAFVFTGLLVFYYRQPIAAFINLPVATVTCLLGFSVITAIFSVFQQLFVAQKKSKEFSSTQVFLQYSKFIGAVIGMYLITEKTYIGKIGGELTAMVLVSFYLLYKIIPYVEWKFSGVHFKYILNYAIPLIPFILSGFILHSFDQWYINAKLGNAEAGLYGFAYTIGILLAGFITSLLSGSNPDYFKWMNRAAYEEIDAQVISLVKLLTIATAFLILFAVDMGTILSSKKSFLSALPIVPVIVMGYFFFGISQFYNRAIYFIKKNVYLIFIVLTAGVANILLNAHYVPIYGYQAAAYTTLVSYFIMCVLSWITTTYLLGLHPLPLKRILVFVVYLALLIAIYYLIFDGVSVSVLGIIQKGIVFTLFAGLVYFYNIRKMIKTL